MLVILWIVFACLSNLADTTYRFRFHTCIEEDQSVLETENLVSLNQVAFIDDGSFSYHDVGSLKKIGIKIEGAVFLSNLTSEYKPGGESALRVITFTGSNKVIVINFWTHTYYVMKSGDKYDLSGADTPIKPDLSHFVRVYFVCVPANSRSALILFGPQATLRRKPRSVEKEEEEHMRVKRNGTKQTEQKKKELTEKDKKRLAITASLRAKVHLTFAVVGFSIAVIINAVFLLICVLVYRNGKGIPTKKEEKAAEQPAKKGTETKKK